MTSRDDDVQRLTIQAGELVEAIDELNEDLGAQVVTLAKVVKRQRRLVRLLLVSVALDIVLSLGLGAIALQASHASHQAQKATSAAAQNKANAMATCEAGNQARAAQVQLWTYVLSVSPATTPAQAERVKKFRAYINRVFAARDCANLSAPPPLPASIPTR